MTGQPMRSERDALEHAVRARQTLTRVIAAAAERGAAVEAEFAIRFPRSTMPPHLASLLVWINDACPVEGKS